MTSGLREIAVKLTELPADDTVLLAGPPFELPDSLSVPDREPDRWLRHLDMIEASRAYIEDRLARPGPLSDGSGRILARLRKLDDEMEEFILEHRLDRQPVAVDAGANGTT
jgi:hypothetical protein